MLLNHYEQNNPNIIKNKIFVGNHVLGHSEKTLGCCTFRLVHYFCQNVVRGMKKGENGTVGGSINYHSFHIFTNKMLISLLNLRIKRSWWPLYLWWAAFRGWRVDSFQPMFYWFHFLGVWRYILVKTKSAAKLTLLLPTFHRNPCGQIVI